MLVAVVMGAKDEPVEPRNDIVLKSGVIPAVDRVTSVVCPLLLSVCCASLSLDRLVVLATPRSVARMDGVPVVFSFSLLRLVVIATSRVEARMGPVFVGFSVLGSRSDVMMEAEGELVGVGDGSVSKPDVFKSVVGELINVARLVMMSVKDGLVVIARSRLELRIGGCVLSVSRLKSVVGVESKDELLEVGKGVVSKPVVGWSTKVARLLVSSRSLVVLDKDGFVATAR
jgi:hypothetical protein